MGYVLGFLVGAKIWKSTFGNSPNHKLAGTRIVGINRKVINIDTGRKHAPGIRSG